MQQKLVVTQYRNHSELCMQMMAAKIVLLLVRFDRVEKAPLQPYSFSRNLTLP